MKSEIGDIAEATVKRMLELMPFAVKMHEGEYPLALTHTIEGARAVKDLNPDSFIMERINHKDGTWEMRLVD